MRKQVKIISLLFAAAIFATACLGAFAANENSIYSRPTNVNSGENFEIPIFISGNTGIMGYGLTITYNAEAFTPIAVNKGSANSGILNDSIDSSESGSFRVIYTGTENFVADGTLFTIEFASSPSASGQEIISISYVQADTFDEGYSDVELNCESVNIFLGEGFTTSQATDLATTEEPTIVPTTKHRPETTTQSIFETTTRHSGESTTHYSVETTERLPTTIPMTIPVTEPTTVPTTEPSTEPSTEPEKPKKSVFDIIVDFFVGVVDFFEMVFKWIEEFIMSFVN